MKVTPVASPAGMIQTKANTGNVSSTERAIAAFNKASQPAATPQAQQTPVANPNKVSPEEMGAITAAPVAEMTEEIVENTNSETLEATEETQVEETQEAKPATDPALSRQFAQLARQEKALRAKAQQQDIAMKAREAAIAAKEAALQTTPKQDLSGYISKDKLKTDALSVLADAGVSYEELTNQILTQQPRDPRTEAHIARLEAKLAALEEANQTTQKSYEEQQAAAYQQAVDQIEVKVKKLVYTDPNFEAIKAEGAHKSVVKLIEDVYHNGLPGNGADIEDLPKGHMMTEAEAAQIIEEHLVEKAMKLSNLKKIKTRMEQASAKPVTTEVKPQATKEQPQMKTLTNATASQRQLSAKERAVLAFKGELNKG